MRGIFNLNSTCQVSNKIKCQSDTSISLGEGGEGAICRTVMDRGVVFCNLIPENQVLGTRCPVQIPNGYMGTKIPDSSTTLNVRVKRLP